jgi:hypothetical protein
MDSSFINLTISVFTFGLLALIKHIEPLATDYEVLLRSYHQTGGMGMEWRRRGMEEWAVRYMRKEHERLR